MNELLYFAKDRDWAQFIDSLLHLMHIPSKRLCNYIDKHFYDKYIDERLYEEDSAD